MINEDEKIKERVDTTRDKRCRQKEKNRVEITKKGIIYRQAWEKADRNRER